MDYLKKFKWVAVLYCISLAVQAQRVNVKDYGAKGDGKTIETKAIYSALNVLYKNGGGELYFPKGVYITNVIDIKPPNKMTIEIVGDAKQSIIKKNVNDPTPVAVFFSESREVNYSFSNLSIDGNYSKRNRHWKKTQNNIVEVHDATNGILIWNADKVMVKGCVIQNVHGSGVAVYSSNTLEVYDTQIKNTSDRGIIGHKLQSMITNSNVIKNTGIFTDTYHVDNVYQNHKGKYMTFYGDGIESEARVFTALNNTISNSGRIGITHDLAIDLGYYNSKATINNNTITVNNDRIYNTNPPAGIWFEQTHDVVVSNNKITIKKSQNALVSAIRFYGITGNVVCENNQIDASNYNLQLNEAIGIFEPLQSSYMIKGNTMKGKFINGISISYEKEKANLKNIVVDNNSILGTTDSLKNGMYLTLYSKLEMPKNVTFTNNKVNVQSDKHFNATYFGNSNKKFSKDSFIIKNNTFEK